MRSLHKSWQNDRGGKWDCRISWYQDSVSIRLKLETTEGVLNKFYKRPDQEEQAKQEWDKFKLDHKKS